MRFELHNYQGRACPAFFIGAKTVEPKIEAEAGSGVLGEGAARGSGERFEFLQRGTRWNPDRPKVFHYFQHSGWPLLTL